MRLENNFSIETNVKKKQNTLFLNTLKNRKAFMILKINYRIYTCVGLLLLCTSTIMAQVQVSEEPMHRNVFQNKYIRLLDVWLQPGDTTQYHVHSTPSLFVYLSSSVISTQVKGEEWVKDQAITGKAWYRSFSPDILVHRVCNLDTVPFHVNDIEILSSYKNKKLPGKKPLPFSVLFENEKAFAYQLTNSAFNMQIIKGRGPMVAELVSGDGIIFHDTKTKHTMKVKTGKYFYIEPGTSFYFTAGGAGEINMIIFEIK